MTDDELDSLTPAAQALCVLLADEVGVGEEFDVEDMDILITIGKALFFSEEYESRVRKIARDFDREADELAGGEDIYTREVKDAERYSKLGHEDADFDD